MATRNRWDTSDVIAADQEARSYPKLEAPIGLQLTHRGSGTRGVIVAFTEGARLVLEDQLGARHEYVPHDGAFAHRGTAVSLRAPAEPAQRSRKITASGSFDVRHESARVARASRIWVEGIHDAELIEHIWGADLRFEGIVVEPLHGIDELDARVAEFVPGPDRRLGVLLDHFVPGTKESRIAATVAHPDVLVTGHPYVDIWQAIRPETVGIPAWPDVPPGKPWKEGVIAALGRTDEPGAFWGAIRSKVTSYRDVETPLITAMEEIIDFVSAG